MADDSESAREARQAAEQKRAAWIVLGSVVAGIVALTIAAVVLTR
jgi:hypothetical protein